MILLIDNYDSFTYNLLHYFAELGEEVQVVRNDVITADEAIAMKPEAVVLSPGPCSPNEAGVCLELVRKAAEVNMPMLGVCLGHQSIAQAFGASVVRGNVPMHGKVSTLTHANEGIFKSLPRSFDVTRYHSLVVEAKSMPACLRVDAHTEDGAIMALAHRSKPIFGVQFHPESVASQHGHDVLKNFMKKARV